MPNSSLPSSRANVRPCNELKVASFRFRGRQRKCHNSFLCFPSKKLTAKIYHIRLTGQFMRTRIQKSLRMKVIRKPASRYQRINQVNLRTLQIGGGSGRNVKNCVVPCCVTQQDNFTLNCAPKAFTIDNFYLMASFIQYNSTVLFLDIPVPVRIVKSQTP